MTVYRIEYRKPNEPDTHVAVLPDGGLLVPVVPCEHGNTGEHGIRDPKRTYHPSELCPGAAVGEDTP